MISAKKILFPFIILTIGLLLISNPVSSQQTSGELYEKALFMEEAQGDLEKAINLYKKILEQFPENREVAARAQLHIGLCYEKLGLKEAQKAFQKVIDNYPEQTEAVKVAKEKLSLLLRARAIIEKGEMEFNIRQIWAGPSVVTYGGLSPDGRYISCNDRETGDLAVLELATGKKRRLTNKGSWYYSRENAFYPIISPNGKQIAYSWIYYDYFFDLRIIGIDGSGLRVLYSNSNREVEFLYPSDWSPDGEHILAIFKKKDSPMQIVLISVADGSVRILKNLIIKKNKWPYIRGFFSPDGRYIAYDFRQKEDLTEHNISMLSIDGNREFLLVENPADERLLGWAPSGKWILFSSDRNVTRDAWIIPVADGKAQDEPELIRRNIGIIWPIGITRKGTFYYSLSTRMYDAYIATLDLRTGKVLASPKKANKQPWAFRHTSDFSPDGGSGPVVKTKSESSLRCMSFSMPQPASSEDKPREACRIP